MNVRLPIRRQAILNLLFLAGLLSVRGVFAQAFPETQKVGRVIGWGDLVIPDVSPGTPFSAISGGAGHSLALKRDGSVVAWGANDNEGQCLVPEGLGGVIAIA